MYAVSGKIVNGLLLYVSKFFGDTLDTIAMCNCSGYSDKMNTIAIVLHGNGPTALQMRLTHEVINWVNENSEDEYNVLYFSTDEFDLVLPEINQVALLWKNGMPLVEVEETEEEAEDAYMDFSNCDDTYIVDDLPFYDEDVVF